MKSFWRRMHVLCLYGTFSFVSTWLRILLAASGHSKNTKLAFVYKPSAALIYELVKQNYSQMWNWDTFKILISQLNLRSTFVPAEPWMRCSVMATEGQSLAEHEKNLHEVWWLVYSSTLNQSVLLKEGLFWELHWDDYKSWNFGQNSVRPRARPRPFQILHSKHWPNMHLHG